MRYYDLKKRKEKGYGWHGKHPQNVPSYLTSATLQKNWKKWGFAGDISTEGRVQIHTQTDLDRCVNPKWIVNASSDPKISFETQKISWLDVTSLSNV